MKYLLMVLLLVSSVCWAEDRSYKGEDGKFSQFVYVATGFFDKEPADIKKGKVIAEIVIYDTGEGCLKIGENEGKISSFEANINIENGAVGGENYMLDYRTSYWDWGSFYPARFYFYSPQENKKDITDKLNIKFKDK